jgi:hypothetical protein
MVEKHKLIQLAAKWKRCPRTGKTLIYRSLQWCEIWKLFRAVYPAVLQNL